LEARVQLDKKIKFWQNKIIIIKWFNVKGFVFS
jgi:hypothetical protein